jgi:quinoprotein glucose dehydrogenase
MLTAVALLPALALPQDHTGWRHYGGGQHGMQYSSLDQITMENVSDLQEVWRVRTGELG